MIVGFFALLGLIVLVLAFVLAAQFVRLGRELRRIGDDSQAMITRFGKGLRSLQVAIPLAIAVREKIIILYRKFRSQTKRKL